MGELNVLSSSLSYFNSSFIRTLDRSDRLFGGVVLCNSGEEGGLLSAAAPGSNKDRPSALRIRRCRVFPPVEGAPPAVMSSTVAGGFF